jgi:DNA-binding NarL/FixJ family response regulator
VTRPTVLIVEDEAIIAMDLEARMASIGFDVVGVVSTHDRAVELAREKRPDVVLMDIGLSHGGDGIEAALEIRATREVPVIFVTSYSDASTLARAKLASPSGYLVKPFGEAQLRAALCDAIGTR